MKKTVAFIIMFCMLIIPPVTSNAGGMDLIRSVMDTKTRKNSGLQIIWNIINPQKQQKEVEQNVKIIKSNEELKEIEQDDRLQEQLLGIDVSKWNGDIDWEQVRKTGVEFAIIRAGYGQTTVDYQFKRNIQGCIDNDILVGVYWFSYAYNTDMAYKEAQFCMKIIEPYKEYIQLGVWFDFEYDSVAYATRSGVRITKDSCTTITETFCKAVEKNGYEAGIYTNLDFINNYYTKDILNRYNIWLAIWNSNVKSIYKDKCIIWQYTNNGKVSGIIGKVDMDIYYGDRK